MKAAVRSPRIVQQPAEGLQTDASLPDMLVPVELRAACGLGVVAVPDVNVLQAHGAIELVKCLGEALLADDVVSRDMGVTGVDAGAGRHAAFQQIKQLGHLLEVAAERELRTRRVFDQDAQVARLQVESIGGLLDCERRALQAFFPAAAAKRSRMQDQEIGAQAPGLARFLPERPQSISCGTPDCRPLD